MTKVRTAWKTLKLINDKIRSESGDMTWELNKWYKETNISICNKGFHASRMTVDAMRYVAPDIFAIVEIDGEVIENDDKLVSEKMRIIKAYNWTKPDSLRFSIFCVKQSMKYFNRKKFPDIWNICLNSIKAIDAVLLNDNDQTKSAARTAASWEAWSAESATVESAWSAAVESVSWAVWSAAESSAESASWAAESAAWAAESAAESAARAAESAAESAARAAARTVQNKWLIKYIKKNCKELK